MRSFESREDYLETILVLYQEKGAVRSIDVAERMKFSKPSVSVAMKNLRQNDLIVMDEDGHISLTPSGLAIAAKMYERHTLISRMLMKLGVSEKAAVEDACRIEHVISEESFEAIKHHISEKTEH